MKESNIIIFGTGAFYTSHKQMLPEGTQVVAFIDNKAMKHGQYLDGVQIYSPQEGVELEYDYVVLASTTPGVPREMKKQLVLFRVPQDKILYWEEYISMQSHGLLMRYDVEDVVAIEGRKKCLIMVPAINFSGGFLTAQYVAIALKKQGYYVTIASSNANEQALVETNQHGINVWICPALPYVSDVELAWIRSYDIVWINCLPMMYSVDRISKYKPVIWWLHEYSARYEDVFEQYGNDVEDMSFSNVDIYAVSNIAKNNFSRFVPDAKVKVLPLGLPDFAKSVRVSKDKIIVAIIGLLFQSKNQKELIQAINLLPESKKNKLECWLIGKDGSKQYREELEKLAEEGTNIRILGELNRREMETVFSKIDAVVCSSYEETMSIAVVEGFMNGKICITTTNTGVAEFIEDGINGFVYTVENIAELSEKLDYMVSHFEGLDNMRVAARDTYERYFSMEVFGKQVTDIITRKQ